MRTDELRVFLRDRGFDLDYMHDWLSDDPRFCWTVSHRDGPPAAWGKDLSESDMVAHILEMPHLHPEKPLGRRFRDFGIELGPFADEYRPNRSGPTERDWK